MFSENGVSRQLLCRVKVNCRVVHLGVGLLQHPYNLATGPDYGTVEYSQGRNAGTDATTPLSNRRGGEATFLERAQKVVNAHLADEDFNADVFAREMAVSRAQLLQTTNDTQAVIAMKVGYSDASNFHRAFIHQFGMTPSEYVKQQKNQIVTPDSQ